MRSGLLCLLCGCNQIFGSHGVIERDADVRPKDAAPYAMQVTGMNVDTTSGDTVTFPPVPNIAVEIGPITTAMPQTVDVDPMTGGFEIPFDLAQTPYRLVYHPPDGVPVEIQSSLHAAHFVVPSLGRLDAVPPPANAQTGDLLVRSSYNNLRVVSTGTWAFRFSGMVNGLGSSVEWTTASTQANPIASMSGALETPNSDKGDRVLLIDGSLATPDAADGFSVGTMTTFGSSGLANLAFSPWKTTTDVGVVSLPWTFMVETDTQARLDRAAGDATGDNGSPVNLVFSYGGVIPSVHVPNFLAAGAGLQIESQPGLLYYKWAARGTGGLGVPSFIPMAKVNSPTSARFVDMFNGADLPAYTTAIYSRLSKTRFTEGIPLTFGLQTIQPVPDGSPTKVPVSLDVGIADSPTQHVTLNNVDLWQTTTTVYSVPRGSGLVPLEFATDAVVDDCLTTVFRIEGAALVAVRRYLTQIVPNSAAAAVQIDPAVFDSTHHYLFGISCHKGLPGVATTASQLGGDWAQVSYPFSESMLYSYPFVVP